MLKSFFIFNLQPVETHSFLSEDSKRVVPAKHQLNLAVVGSLKFHVINYLQGCIWMQRKWLLQIVGESLKITVHNFGANKICSMYTYAHSNPKYVIRNSVQLFKDPEPRFFPSLAQTKFSLILTKSSGWILLESNHTLNFVTAFFT